MSWRVKHDLAGGGVREASQTLTAAANASERCLVLLVLVVAAAGVAGPAPGRAVVAGHGIDIAPAGPRLPPRPALRPARPAPRPPAPRRLRVAVPVRTPALSPPAPPPP